MDWSVVAVVGAGLVLSPLVAEAVDWGPSERSFFPVRRTCHSCGELAPWSARLPIVGWRRPPCAACGSRRPVAEVVAEGATPGVLGLTVWWFGASWALLAFGYLAVIAIVLTAIDLAEHRLPNRIVLPSYLVAAGLLAAASAVDGNWSDMVRAGLGLAAMGGFYFVLAMINPSGLGFGDVKLAGLLGAYLGWLGWPEVVIGAIGGFVLGGVLSLVLVAARLADRKTPIPFGPFMLLGAALAVVLGQPVADWYLR